MGLKFTFSHSVDDVFDLICDPNFLVERSMALGEISADAETEEDDNGKILISMRREVKQDLPSFLAKMFSSEQVITMHEEWQQIGTSFIGKGTYDVEGQPVTIKTEMTLKPEGDGSIYSITYHSKAKIPIIGKKVEKFIEGNCEDGALKELEFIAKRLA